MNPEPTAHPGFVFQPGFSRFRIQHLFCEPADIENTARTQCSRFLKSVITIISCGRLRAKSAAVHVCFHMVVPATCDVDHKKKTSENVKLVQVLPFCTENSVPILVFWLITTTLEINDEKANFDWFCFWFTSFCW